MEYAGIDVSLVLRFGIWTRLCLVKCVFLSPAIERKLRRVLLLCRKVSRSPDPPSIESAHKMRHTGLDCCARKAELCGDSDECCGG
jgi:hypothetical protein